ncbi:MAG TPA: thiamine pyrophosphate-binding protein [Burkholderiales bacterium]|nr:thiamine pyrophosphate-binding protein [Burkholderiales bacterium]
MLLVPAAIYPPMTKINGRSAFLRLLASEGVEYLFGNPGTTELPIMEALGKQSEIRYVLGLQEAVVVGMADGYARASGKIGACNVHVAPGLGNAIGALYNAKFAGSPVIITAGQQEQGHGLTEPLLYDPLVPIAQPMVKWAIEVTRVEDLPRIVRRAAKVATAPPAGPVFISLPGDVLDGETDVDLGRPTRVDTRTRPSEEAVEAFAKRLLAARNPVLVAGHELQVYDALALAGELAEALGAPVYQQTMQHSAQFHSEHPCFMGSISRQQPEVRKLLEPYDAALFLGGDVLRMSVYSPVDPLPPGTAVLQIAERDWELGKNYPAEIALNTNVKETLKVLVPAVRRLGGAARAEESARRVAKLAASNWSAQRAKLAAAAEKIDGAKPIDPRVLMLRIADALPENAVVVDEGVTSSASLHAFRALRHAHAHFGMASGGIGWGIAAANGVSIALPGRPVCAIIGDGSAMYSVQALWTAAHYRLPVTFVIANNRSYRILKERLVSMRGTEKHVGMDIRDPAIEWVGLAQSLGVPARRVTDAADIAPAIREATARSGPSLIDAVVQDGFE